MFGMDSCFGIQLYLSDRVVPSICEFRTFVEVYYNLIFAALRTFIEFN